MTNLMLHCGASKIERGALATIATPQPTESWFPIPHTVLIERVEQTLAATQMRVVNEAHGLSAEGLRYFGLLEVANCQQTEDYAYVLGLRNSHDKRFPAGLAVGASVFVCDNLSFSGEIKIGRKHTRHLDRDLPRMVSSAVGQLADRWHEQSRRIAAYRSHEIGDKQVHDLILRALDARAITLTQIRASSPSGARPARGVPRGRQNRVAAL